MHFREWAALQSVGVLTRLSREHELAYMTVWKATQGRPVSYRVAKILSEATSGAVSVDELCDPSARTEAAE